jgi:nucleoside-diphosphate-sugar epimerase
MDRDGAIKLLDAARAVGTRRYVIISSIGAESPPPGDEPFSVYLQAKAAADAAVAASDRDWTIVRPGPADRQPGDGPRAAPGDPFRADVTRDDVAAVLAAVLPEPRSHGVTMYLGGGDDPIEQALGRCCEGAARRRVAPRDSGRHSLRPRQVPAPRELSGGDGGAARRRPDLRRADDRQDLEALEDGTPQ